MTKITPLPGYVLIEPIKDDNLSDGVYLPESTQDKPSKGKVIAVGIIAVPQMIELRTWNEYQDYNLKYKSEINEGAIVIYKKWSNQEVQHEGKKYLLVKFDELLAIIE